jgi:hypothetical protein
MCDRASYITMTRSTNLMQQLWFIIINHSCCIQLAFLVILKLHLGMRIFCPLKMMDK